MTCRKDDSLQSISVQLDGKNYSYWGYVMKNFLRGKSMWGYASGVRLKPTDKNATDYADSLDTWEADNAKIITWINNLLHTPLVLSWPSMRLSNRFGIIWKDCTRGLTLPNNINWKPIFAHFGKKIWASKNFILPCLNYGTSWQSQNHQNCEHFQLT